MSVWNTLAKAQAKALKDALTNQGHTLTLSQCREARSRLAGYPNWNPYCARLKEDRASTRLPDQPKRLIQELAVVGLNLPLEQASHALTQMQQASGGVWEAEVKGHEIILTTLHIRNPDSPYGEQIQSWLEQNEDDILECLELARPFQSPIHDGIPEAAAYLQELFELEGPGHLTQARTTQGEVAWFYTRTLEDAYILAILFTQHPDLPTFTIGGSGLIQSGRKPVTRQIAELWRTTEGMESYRTIIQAKYVPDFPRHADRPTETSSHDPALTCWEAAELLALESRLTPALHPALSGEWERVQPEQARNGDTLLIDLAVVTVREIEGFQGGYFSFYSTDGGVWDVPVSDPLWRKLERKSR